MGTAKSLREFEQMDWIPIDFGRLFDKARPHPNQRGMAKVIAEDFPPDNHMGYTFGNESAGDIIRKLFEEKEEEIDLDEVLEVKRIMGVKSESSPYVHIAQVYAIGSDQGEGNPLPTPRVDCMIDGIKCCNVLCDIGAHVSVISSKVYVELFNKTPNLDATIIKLIMGDGRLIKLLGVLRNLNVAIAGKEIPTFFFVINASDDEHESIILGKPLSQISKCYSRCWKRDCHF